MQADVNASQKDVQHSTQERNTGPLQGVKNWLSGLGKRKAISSDDEQGTAFSRMRAKIEEFDEDYRNPGERLLGFFMQSVGYIGPYIIVIGVGSDLGAFFAPVWGAFSSGLIAYVLESVIASCTVAMGRAFEEMSSGKAGRGKVTLTVMVWAVLNASSAFGLYWQASQGGLVHDHTASLMLIMRVGAIALADLGCSCVLMWRGKSMQKHIESIRKRATAIGELADAERSMEEADKNAKLREQQMQATLRIQEQMTDKIGQAVSMVMESILERMDKALKSDGNTKNDRRYGRE